ncbi:MAG: LysR family transcriptional regulator [Marinobacter sp.]|uniref:LysR family transcriptional regulator n=1 Tax=Marinobacter sp. TaxID=50741 RepID=UPI001B471E17|nr:LysR family transcriptional regulator [Marinobacter sp.]MBQ0745680.1 LysR family transcriptional regulator [Marinobacter sp.]MBQ0813934.1 LysR family transcriptional regulator [Marinobacter sp.]|tara:strand:- start:5428 stop:6315 length:888 start_codon:yes stop_codon:yes gene_type:complete
MINTTWLRSFCTLVEVGHFTRTAERLHMTQSGVSQHVRKLEDQLETALLFREGKQFSLTDAGQRLYAEGRTIIQALSNLEQRVADDPAYEGLVRVMSPGSVGLKLYPHLLELQRQYPKLVIDYRFAPNTDIERAISDDRIDIGFMTSASTLEDVSCQPIARESLLLVTPADVVEPSWEALTKLGFIDHPDGAHHAGMLLGANYSEFQHSNLFKTKGFSNQIGLILEPVSMGLGFTVLPAHAVEAFQNPQLVRIHRLAVPVNETLHLAVRRERPLQNRMNTVIAETRKCLQIPCLK